MKSIRITAAALAITLALLAFASCTPGKPETTTAAVTTEAETTEAVTTEAVTTEAETTAEETFEVVLEGEPVPHELEGDVEYVGDPFEDEGGELMGKIVAPVTDSAVKENTKE